MIDDCVAATDYLINIVAEEGTGIGTDRGQDQDVSFFDYLSADKGKRRTTTGKRYTNGPKMPKGLETLRDFSNSITAMERAGWKERCIRRGLGENWLRFLGDVSGAQDV